MVEPKRLRLIESDSAEDAALALGERANVFESRLRRKIKEKDDREAEAQRATTLRQQQILRTMTTIRKALADTVKIKLGERFRFDLHVGDWEGWPRLQLRLIDLYIPNEVPLALKVSAHDRHGLGTILLGMNDSEVLGTVHLADPLEIPRVPLVLKKSVRIFLDSVTAYVLAPKDPSESARSINLEEEQEIDEVAASLKTEHVFSDEDNDNSENVLKPEVEVKPLDSF